MMNGHRTTTFVDVVRISLDHALLKHEPPSSLQSHGLDNSSCFSRFLNAWSGDEKTMNKFNVLETSGSALGFILIEPCIKRYM
jgi:hypothetical protein